MKRFQVTYLDAKEIKRKMSLAITPHVYLCVESLLSLGLWC